MGLFDKEDDSHEAQKGCMEFENRQLHKKHETKKKNKSAKASELKQLLRTQDFRCALSGVKLTPSTSVLDHIEAMSTGGTNQIENLQWLHVDVNRAKGTQSQEEFIAMCRRVAAYLG